MRLTTISAFDSIDYRDAFTIEVNTEEAGREISFIDGEPEDNRLSRDFGGVYGIPELIRLAYEAGKNGELFEFYEKTVSWDEI